MSQPTTEQLEIPPAPVRVETQPGSRLQQLHAAYDTAKGEVKQAEERFDAIADAIKGELSAALPAGGTKALLTGTDGARPLQLQWVESWTFDSKKLKAVDPHTYVRYARKGGYWKLAALSGGEES